MAAMEHAEGDRDRGSMLARAASQSSLDESSQRAAAAERGWDEDAEGEEEEAEGEAEGREGEEGRAGEEEPGPEAAQDEAAHAARLLGALCSLQRERALCDVVLHARAPRGGGGDDDKGCSDAEATRAADAEAAAEADADAEDDGSGVAAHRAVLAACSPYFRAMFSGWAERGRRHVTLRDVEPGALASIVGWMYRPGSLRVTPRGVQALLAAASLLQVGGVRAAAARWLQAALAPDNALGILAFAELHACGALAAAARRHVARRFPAVAAADEFLALPAPALLALLADDALGGGGGGGEELLLDAALRWLRHEPGRQRHLYEVMSRIRLALLPREALVARARAPPLRCAGADVKDLLIEALSFQLLRPPPALPLPPCARPRRPPRAPRLLLLVGGQAPKAVRDVEAFSPERGRWAPRRPLPTRRCRAGLAALRGRVYAVGGFNGTLRVRGVDVYDPRTDAWTAGPPLCARRSTLGVCALDGRLYAVGGFDGAAGLGSAEVLEPDEAGGGAWRPVADMSTRRSSVGVCALEGHVYAVGGYDGASRQCLASVERYEPAADRWLPVPPMAARRSGAGVAALGGLLYAVGGHDGPAVRRSVERYCPRGGWRPAPPMLRARRNAAVVAHEGRLYAAGGDDGAANLDSVEVFDPAAEAWSELPARMALGRSYAGLALVERPPSA